jgi:hypothetical protein
MPCRFYRITILPTSTYVLIAGVADCTGGSYIQTAYKNRSLIKSGLEDADDTTS